jgi:predicted secreted protein
MAITSALVLLAVIWFMVLFVVLPLNLKTQSETGDVVPGTPGSAPTDPQLRRKALIVTAVSVPLWIVACTVIVTGTITIDDFDLFSRFGPDADRVSPGTGG